mgnify:CR=1 FL=1
MLKRKLAALLAGVMVIASLPMVSFAASDNRIDKVPTIKKDTELNDTNLIINPKAGDNVNLGEKFTLTFENAEWRSDAGATGEIAGQFAYKVITKKMVEFTLERSVTNGEDELRIPMFVKVTDAGEAKVTIDPMATNISAGSYVIANAGDGSTKTTVLGTPDFPNSLKLDTIMIEELKPGSIENVSTKDREIKLTAPAGFEWVDGLANVTLEAAGGFDTITPYSSEYEKYGRHNQNDDKEILIIKYRATRTAQNTNGRIIIKDLQLKSTLDAEFGDVNVKFAGSNITEETLKVGKYIEYGVTVKADGDPNELFSGKWEMNDLENDPENAEKGDHELQKLVIEENTVNSWASERRTVIEYPEWFKITRVKVDDASEIAGAPFKGVDESDSRITVNADRNIIILSDIEVNSGKKGKVVLKVWGSIEGGVEGDLVAEVSGQALPEAFEVTLAKVVPVVKAAIKTAEVQLGYREVAVNDVTITETKAGAFKRGKVLSFRAESMGFNKNYKPVVEVTGDLVLGDARVANGMVSMEVKRESKEASTIVVKGLTVDISRSLPEGSYSLLIGGNRLDDAVVANFKEVDGPINDKYQFNVDAIEVENFIKIITPAPHKGEASGSLSKVSFTVGATEYTVGEDVAVADAAPYIKDGRTMLPVKYVAYALGIEPQNIKWDQATKTATILGDRVIQVKVGSKELVVNGAVLQMDTAAEVVDGRTFLPIAWVASALNVPYTWEDATKTVTFN